MNVLRYHDRCTIQMHHDADLCDLPDVVLLPLVSQPAQAGMIIIAVQHVHPLHCWMDDMRRSYGTGASGPLSHPEHQLFDSLLLSTS